MFFNGRNNIIKEYVSDQVKNRRKLLIKNIRNLKRCLGQIFREDNFFKDVL